MLRSDNSSRSFPIDWQNRQKWLARQIEHRVLVEGQQKQLRNLDRSGINWVNLPQGVESLRLLQNPFLPEISQRDVESLERSPMKFSSWLTRLSSRRQSHRPVRVAEVFEPRRLMDATLPDLIEETGESNEEEDLEMEPAACEDAGGDCAPEVIFYTLSGAGSVSPISQFGSREELGEYLLERALARYDGMFGQAAWWYHGPVYYRSGVFTAMADAPTSVDFSETNTQVEGVDEGDVIENDGKYLYLLNNNQLVILQADPAAEMQELSRVAFDGYAIAEYLDGDRLTVISQEYSYGDSYYGGFVGIRIAAPSSDATVVSVFDVSDPSAPTLEKQVRLDGSYVDSRAFNGQVHVITTNDLALPAPEMDGTTTIEVPFYYYGWFGVEDAPAVDDAVVEGDSLTIQPTDTVDALGIVSTDDVFIKTQTIEVPVYESREAYIARVRANLSDLIDDALPQYEGATAQGLAATGVISEITSIARVNDSVSDALMSVVTIDVRDPQPGLVSSSSVMADWSNGIFANQEHLYVFSPIYGESGTQTRILEFAWANGEREIELIASGVVDGSLHNQFSADEHDGRLRIATTTFEYDAETGNFAQANNLVILENVDGLLSEVGSVEGFAAGEQIYSVRFDGDRAFVVTFRQTDPLFVFDLTDPATPTILGELHVPGFSSYLQVIDEDHLLSVGRDVDTFSTKVALYDVSDLSNPIEVDSDSLPSWTWSQAEWDSKAVAWFALHHTLAIPTSGWDEFGYHNELSVFHIDVTQSGEDAIQQTGEVEDDGYITRSAYIGNVLYTISNDSVIASDINDPSNIINQVDFAFDPFVAFLSIDPVYVETDDGASDWEYIDPPESLDEAEGLLALAAVNVLDGTTRVSLLDAESLVTGTLGGDTLTLKARGHQTIQIPLGESGALVIEGTAEADRLNLRVKSGEDSALATITVNAGEGNDRVQLLTLHPSRTSLLTINGESGNDRVNVAESIRLGVQINGGDGADSLTGGGGDDSIDGGADGDSLSGGNGSDLILGGDGDDLLRGRNGDDTLGGGAGADRIFGGIGNDALAGGEDNDRLYGERGNDTLLGQDGNDKLYGSAGNDVALGGDGDDLVDGGLGLGDILSGGAGTNTIRGRHSEIHAAFTFDADWLDLI